MLINNEELYIKCTALVIEKKNPLVVCLIKSHAFYLCCGQTKAPRRHSYIKPIPKIIRTEIIVFIPIEPSVRNPITHGNNSDISTSKIKKRIPTT